MARSITPESSLIRVLQHACSGELAAGFAYRGHAGSVISLGERERLLLIESEEWHHRRLVQGLLAQLGARPETRARRRFLAHRKVYRVDLLHRRMVRSDVWRWTTGAVEHQGIRGGCTIGA